MLVDDETATKTKKKDFQDRGPIGAWQNIHINNNDVSH